MKHNEYSIKRMDEVKEGDSLNINGVVYNVLFNRAPRGVDLPNMIGCRRPRGKRCYLFGAWQQTRGVHFDHSPVVV